MVGATTSFPEPSENCGGRRSHRFLKRVNGKKKDVMKSRGMDRLVVIMKIKLQDELKGGQCRGVLLFGVLFHLGRLRTERFQLTDKILSLPRPGWRLWMGVKTRY